MPQHYSFQCIIDRVLAMNPGAVPVWNPYSFCGSPLLADPQFQVAYPSSLVYRFLPFPWAYNLFLGLHAALAATGMVCFLRLQGLAGPALAFGGLGIALGASTFMQAVTVPVLASTAWLPWVAYAACRFRTDRNAANFCFLALVFSWQWLAGWPQSLLYSSLLALILLFPYAIAAIAPLVAGLAIASVVALPFAGYLPATARIHRLPAVMATADVLHWSSLKMYVLALPVILTDWGTVVGSRQWWSSLHFVGTMCVPLALLRLVWPGRGEMKRLAVVLAIAGLILGWMPTMPVVGEWFIRVPPFSLIRRSAFWLQLTDFALAWLGAEGMVIMTRLVGFRLASVLVAFTYLELLTVGFTAQPNAPSRWLMEPAPEERILLERAGPMQAWCRIHVLPGNMGEVLVGGASMEEAVRGIRSSLQPNLPASVGLHDAGGSNPLQSFATQRALEKVDYEIAGDAARAAFLKRMGVAYVLSSWPIEGMGRKVYDGPLQIVALSGWQGPLSIEPGANGTIDGVEHGAAARWDVEVNLRRPARLVLRESFVPGWRVGVDGRPRRPCAGDDGWVETVVPAGRHHILLVYDPLAARVGFWLSAIALVVVGLLGSAVHRTKQRGKLVIE